MALRRLWTGSCNRGKLVNQRPSGADGRTRALMLDETHSPSRMSWVAGSQDHPDFPIQNLPLGVFSPPGGQPRGGIAIGDSILDIQAALAVGVLDGGAKDA